jgi:hypothetical protein
MNKVMKILFLPLVTFMFLFLLIKVDFFPYFFQKVHIPQIMYRVCYPSVKSFSGLEAIGFAYIFIGFVLGSIFLFIGILLKDKYFKIGSFLVVEMFICIIVLGIYLQFFYK